MREVWNHLENIDWPTVNEILSLIFFKKQRYTASSFGNELILTNNQGKESENKETRPESIIDEFSIDWQRKKPKT